MFVHANIATVPAFAPVHEYADWYWAFLETKPDMVLHPTCPLPEVVAWHREHARRPPVRRLHPRAHLRALRRRRRTRSSSTTRACATSCTSPSTTTASAGGTPRTPTRSSVQLGPEARRHRRARRRGAPARARVRLLLLAARLGHRRLSRRGALRRRVHAPADPGAGRAVRARAAVGRRALGPSRAALARRPDRSPTRVRYAAARGFELVFNDRWFASRARLRRVRVRRSRRCRPTGRWELCRGLGYSFCVNRNERVDDHLDRGAGGRAARRDRRQGRQPAAQRRPERRRHRARDPGAAAARVRARGCARNADAIHGSTRFDVPGDGQHWYTRAGDSVHAFDLSSAPEPRFAGARRRAARARGRRRRARVPRRVGRARGRRARGRAASVRHALRRRARRARARDAWSSRAPGGAARAGRRYATITEALAGAAPGDVVDVGPGPLHDRDRRDVPARRAGRRDAARRGGRWRRAGS